MTAGHVARCGLADGRRERVSSSERETRWLSYTQASNEIIDEDESGVIGVRYELLNSHTSLMIANQHLSCPAQIQSIFHIFDGFQRVDMSSVELATSFKLYPEISV